MLNLIERIARVGAWAGGLGFILVSFVVLLEVVLRRVFGVGLSAATELSSYVLAIAAAWGFSFALMQRAHVRVDALVLLLPGPMRAWVDVLAQLALSWLAVMLLWHGSSVLAFSWETQAVAMTPLQTPMWMPQLLWLSGLALFALACVVVLGRALRLLLAGETAAVGALVGTLTGKEEADAEVEEAKLRYTLGPREDGR